MSLIPIQFVKNWFRKTRTREENWDEISGKTAAYSLRTNNNLKQLGFDLAGGTYQFNNTGVGTFQTPLLDQVTEIANRIDQAGTRNIGLDLTDRFKVKVVNANGNDLSEEEPGYVTIPDRNNPGLVKTYVLTTNLEVTLTGAHWGFDGFGDLSDIFLWIMFIDTGNGLILGVAKNGKRTVITTTDAETLVGNVDEPQKVLTSANLASDGTVAYLGWVRATFDDTGNGGGENFWEIGNTPGDVNINSVTGNNYVYDEGLFLNSVSGPIDLGIGVDGGFVTIATGSFFALTTGYYRIETDFDIQVQTTGATPPNMETAFSLVVGGATVDSTVHKVQYTTNIGTTKRDHIRLVGYKYVLAGTLTSINVQKQNTASVGATSRTINPTGTLTIRSQKATNKLLEDTF